MIDKRCGWSLEGENKVEFKKKTKSGNVRVDLTPIELCYLLAIVGATSTSFDSEVYPDHIDKMDGWDLFKKMDDIMDGDEEISKFRQKPNGWIEFRGWGDE